MIWLHGLGDTALGWFDIFKSEHNFVNKHTKIILLTAKSYPITLNGGIVMNAWYDIKKFPNS